MANSGLRYTGSVLVAVAVTLSAFFAMHLLIRNDGIVVAPDEAASAIRFEQIEIVSEIDPEPRFVKPPREKVEELPPLPSPLTHEPIDLPPFDRTQFIPAKVGVGPALSPPGWGPRRSEAADGSCRTRIAPQYPREMALRGIEGEVTVAFTITTAGTVRDVTVVDSNPPRAFDLAAVRAVARWNCEPRMVNGAAVEQRVTQTIDFKLDTP